MSAHFRLFSRVSKRPCLSQRIGAAIAALALAACAADTNGGPRIAADEAGFAPSSDRKAVTATRRMVASANPLASRAGLDILGRGGSAVDAAIAMQLVLTLVEPQSSGIGGGGFLLHHNAETGRIDAYEGREAAPGAVTETLFMKPDGTAMARSRYRVGGISAAVPGTLRLLERVHRRHGRLKWADLFTPAIRLAERGFKVSRRLNASIARDRYLGQYPVARSYFFAADGTPLKVGTLLKNPRLARTLRAVARGGANAFYRGGVARDMARVVRADKKRPGKMRFGDVVGYKVKRRDTVCAPYRSWLVCGFGPPTTGGIATLMTLGLLERFDLAGLKPGSAEAVHLISEATKLVNADRLRYVGDPDVVTVPVNGLLDRGYLSRRSALIRRDRAMKKSRPGKIPMLAPNIAGLAASDDIEQPSTTHMSVVDGRGNTVAMTSSIGSAFGSRIMVGGFMLNNHATDFSPVPRTKSGRPKVNRPGPNKRPRSSQSPTLVFDGSGKLAYALGSPGGSRIIAYVVKTLIGVLDWKLDIQTAISLPNHAVRRGRIDLERGTALEVIAPKLRALGHRVRVRALTSGLQGIAITKDGLTGGADPRREGLVLGE